MRHFLDIPSLVQALRALGVSELQTDSRQLQTGHGFIAWPGYGLDARQFVQQALAQGAAACVVEAQGVATWGFHDARILSLPQLKEQAGALAAAYYGQPSQQLQACAFTGTNGKTSSAWWLAQAIEALPAAAQRHGCGHIGTLGVGRVPQVVSTGLTTPDPITVQRQLATFVQTGCDTVALEASSIGIVEGRLTGLQLHTACFTNFSQDHLDYHSDMASYWLAKRALFDSPGLQAAVINLDDAKGQELLAYCHSRDVICWSYAINNPQASVWAEQIEASASGMRFVLGYGQARQTLALPIFGHYNISNLLGVCACLLSLGVSFEHAASALAAITAVPGRMEQVSSAGPSAVVDYAHTPDALALALDALRPSVQARGGQLWCVFGCGGNRDSSKRPLMGQAAARHADVVVLTSDNPRLEDPASIISQIAAGMNPPARHTDTDRPAAIAWALRHAAAQDLVLVAGKGHENYQDIGGHQLPYSDQAEIQTIMTNTPTALFTLGQAHAWLAAHGITAQLVGAADTPISRLHTDTRSLQAGDLFVALKGESFDANTMLASAQAAGASAAVTHQDLQAAGWIGLQVPDTKAALAAIAHGWRQQFQLPLIAVTGSNGKTTVTQMIASILRAHCGPEGYLATQGNFNNDIGVPLTLLRLRPEHRIGVVELGMNHPGEIAALAQWVEPQVAIINNAQREHQEFMLSVIAVAEENGSVLQHLTPGGTAVYPADDAYAPIWHDLSAGQSRLLFGHDAEADLYPTQAEWQHGAWQVLAHTPAGPLQFALRLAGRHHVKNALAAAAACLAAGVPLTAIATGLGQFEAVAGRCRALSLQLGERQLELIDDSYNANPDSVLAAIDLLSELPGPHLLVLGDMGEVGNQAQQCHAEVGIYAAQRGIESLYTVGEWMQYAAEHFPGARHFADMPALQAACLADAPHYRSILVKGSRFMRMETIVTALSAAAKEKSHVA